MVGGREQEDEGQRAGDQGKGGKGESERGQMGINPGERTSCCYRDGSLEELGNREAAQQQRKLFPSR